MNTGILDNIYSKSISNINPEHAKEFEQYLSKPQVSIFMGSLAPKTRKAAIQILDPGSANGLLGITAAIQAYEDGAKSVHLVCVELDNNMIPVLEENLKQFKVQNTAFTFEIHKGDYLIMNNLGCFDIIISNPPYGKISPTEERGGNSPNLYTRFLEKSLEFLSEEGSMVFIIPRSFANGIYFKNFREFFLKVVHITHLHLFESRKDIFDQGVLQEVIIMAVSKGKPKSKQVIITHSQAVSDLKHRSKIKVTRSIIQRTEKYHHSIVMPKNQEELEILKKFNSWKGRLQDHGVDVSTGRVVKFRALKFLREDDPDGTCLPVIFPNHFKDGEIEWPLKNFKGMQYIRKEAPVQLTPNCNYILMKRFTTKDERKRLVTVVYKKSTFDTEYIGLGNKINYFHKPGKKLTLKFCNSLCKLLKTHFYDTYFRIVNGQTQVNATDFYIMPMPPIEVIETFTKVSKKKSEEVHNYLMNA